MSTLVLPPPSDGFGNAPVHKMPSNSTMGWEEEEEDVTFDSPQEEIAHYREKHRQALDMLTETRAELDEFQQSSKELEDEMEAELASNERVQAELKEKINRLEIEKEDWKNKQIALQKMHSSTTAAMQREMDNLRKERDNTLVALRDLEMGNDELERNERVAVSSLLDLESKYNRAIEEKTLLEQEIVQKQELEEDFQRLKDEMRDANNEISILKDQIARMALPTPPSSISEQTSSSPVQEEHMGLPSTEPEIDPASIPLPPPVPYKSSTNNGKPAPSPSRRLPRSATSSSIPTIASPVAKRFTSSIPQSPTMSSLSRSTTSRNLAAVAKTPQSPSTTRVNGLSRSRSGLPLANASPGTVRVVAHQQTKSRGFKLLHDLQARLKATDDKLGVAKVPRRNVSNPLSNAFGVGNGASKLRSTSAASSNTSKGKEKEKDKEEKQVKLINPRITALSQSQAKDPNRTSNSSAGGTPMTSSNSSFMSPNGWVLVDGQEDDDDDYYGNNNVTPTASAFMHGNGQNVKEREEPLSPIDQTFGLISSTATRAVSSASTSSQKSLPSRPGIPSPLTNINGLNKSTTNGNNDKITRKPSYSTRANGVPFPTTNNPHPVTSARNMKPTSATNGLNKNPLSPGRTKSYASSRPMSPSSMIPTSTSSSSSSRPMSPQILNTMTASSSRPMSPSSMLPQLTNRPLRAPSPVVSSSASSRPSSRSDKRITIAGGIGRGSPPSFNNRHNTQLSTSTSIPKDSQQGQQQLRRSTRRSSLGASEFNLPPTGIPAPASTATAREREHGNGTRTPTRPVTIHGDTPPPVPRIPSGLRKK